jgi:hypothetical protein
LIVNRKVGSSLATFEKIVKEIEAASSNPAVHDHPRTTTRARLTRILTPWQHTLAYISALHR